MEAQVAPRKMGRSVSFWMTIRSMMLEKPHELVLVNTYNHPTLAYRARKAINEGMNSAFPEQGQWKATVIRDNQSKFIGPISGKITYRHDLFLVYTPPQGR